MRLPHFAFQFELGRFMATLGIIDDVDESDEDGFYGASSPGVVDGDPDEDAELLEEHTVPLGFGNYPSGYDGEDV